MFINKSLNFIRNFKDLSHKTTQFANRSYQATKLFSLIVFYLSKYYIARCELDDCIIGLAEKLSEQSPIYVKILQALAGSNGLTSKRIQDYLKQFSEDVPYKSEDVDIAELHNYLEQIGKEKPDMQIINISPLPIHSGTISVVFEGVMVTPSNDTGVVPVVIKCVRKGIREQLNNALDDVCFILRMLNSIPHVRDLNITNIVNGNREILLKQTSMNFELSSLTKMYENFKEREYVVIPKPYPYFTLNNDDVLVMDKIEGRRIDEIVNDNEKQIYGNILSKFLLDAVIVDGSYHGDLHRGNIFFMRDVIDSKIVSKIGVIDFGIIINLDEFDTVMLKTFFIGLASKNYDDIADSLMFLTNINKIGLDIIKQETRNEIHNIVKTTLKNTCESKDGFHADNFIIINRIFIKHGVEVTPTFWHLEMAFAMNASISNMLDTKSKNFMNYIQDVVAERIDLSFLDV